MSSTETLARYGLFFEPAFLDPGACAALCALARDSPSRPATVISRGVARLDPELRRAHCADPAPGALGAVEDRLRALVPRLERHFGVALSGLQRLQLVVYREGDFFRAHSDSDAHPESPGRLRDRKVSVVVFLNEPSRASDAEGFGGGSLAFYRLVEPPTWDNSRLTLDPARGLLVAFRSSIFHEVTPVTRGERFTVVTWFV